MIFSELYSAYYNAVARIIEAAVDHPVSKKELRRIVEETAFSESILNIEPALTEERWQLLKPDGTTTLEKAPTMPLTTIQKRWLKAVSLDPRIRLFGDDLIDLPDEEPLFTDEDYMVFDRYSDGDDYTDENYIRNFRMILDAIGEEVPLRIGMANRRGERQKNIVLPKYLEYSEKDDKFRLIAIGKKSKYTYNLGRITECERYDGPYDKNVLRERRSRMCSVTFMLYDQRKALERVLMHFAHFEKQVEKTGEQEYRVTLRYDHDDETELVIRILSFGPMVRVLEPESFTELIRDRLRRQMDCGLCSD